MKEKDALITSMNEQLKSLQVRTYEDSQNFYLSSYTCNGHQNSQVFNPEFFLFSRLKCQH